MKTAFKFLFLSFLLSQSSFSQTKIDYFKKVIDSTKNKELKLNSLDSLIQLTKNKDLKAYANYIETFVAEAISQQKYNKAIKNAVNGFYRINNRLGQPKRALKILATVEKHKAKTKDSFLLGSIFLKKGGGHFNLNNLNEAIKNYQLAVSFFGKKDSIYKADAIYFTGQAHFELSNYIQSINNYKLASKYYENLGDLEYMFQTKESIISIYGSTGFNKKAIEEREKLISEKIKKNHTNTIGVNYYNQSLNYKKIGNIAKQKECLQLALKFMLKHKEKAFQLPIIYGQLSKFHSVNNNLSKAKEYLDLSLKALSGKNTESYPYLFYKKARCYYLFYSKQYQKAKTATSNLIAQQSKSNRADFEMEMNNLLSNIYSKLGDSSNALKYFKQHSIIKDSLRNITKLNALSYYQTLYETEKKEKEINQQKGDIRLLAEENKSKNKLLIFGGLGVLLSFITLYLYLNRLRLKKKKEMQEDFSQKLLLSQEEERKRISKDLHDGLGQSLLLIKNKISLNSDNSTANLVNNAIEEMRSISRILHPFQLEDIGISRALENMIIQLDENYKDIYIFGDIDIIKHQLTPDQEVNIFRIIQECLNNVIKHSKAKSAKVSLMHHNNHINITIKDNGIGFDFSEKYNDFKSLGLKTIKERVKFLNGSLKIDSNKNEGSIFTVIIPD